jgi:hypothetical protein
MREEESRMKYGAKKGAQILQGLESLGEEFKFYSKVNGKSQIHYLKWCIHTIQFTFTSVIIEGVP